MEQHFLVTGGCGFIGSNFINKHFMLYPDSYIVNLDSLCIASSVHNIHKLVSESSRYVFVEGNICDYDLVMHILKTYEIDVVIHFAGRDHVPDAIRDSWKYIQDNIVGTHTLLEACKTYGDLDKFIHISTDKVYGENSTSSDEQWVLCPTNPYAASKASAELLVTSYYCTFNLPVIITRLSNVYGLHQSGDKIIPKFIALLKEDKKVTVYGDGKTLRTYSHVYDVTNAIDFVILKGEVGETYQLDNKDDECSVLDIAKGLILLMVDVKFETDEDYEPYIEYVTDPSPTATGSSARYYVSNDKLKKLGWVSEIPFVEGIVELIKLN
jgi:dTDP-glucose 4,6-dehydratase